MGTRDAHEGNKDRGYPRPTNSLKGLFFTHLKITMYRGGPVGTADSLSVQAAGRWRRQLSAVGPRHLALDNRRFSSWQSTVTAEAVDNRRFSSRPYLRTTSPAPSRGSPPPPPAYPSGPSHTACHTSGNGEAQIRRGCTFCAALTPLKPSIRASVFASKPPSAPRKSSSRKSSSARACCPPSCAGRRPCWWVEGKCAV